MKERHIEDGKISQHGRGLGTVTEAMVMKRARELAVINGRSRKQVLDSDMEQARRELTGEEPLAPEASAAEQVPEEGRWQSVPESVGRKEPALAADDEQTFSEKLVEEGAEEAEHEQMLQATRERKRREIEG